MKYYDKHISKALVVGLGFRSGLAAANFMARRGVAVTVSDTKSADELSDIIARLEPAVVVKAGEQDVSLLDAGFDLLVLSPGVPASIPLVREAEKRGVKVIAEIELACAFIRGGIIAITGTDGKSTTTSLAGHILSSLGFHTIVGGNIGVPLVSLVEETTDESVSVIELSSFQLETIDRFHADVAAILNLSPDHLDRYDGMDDYFAAKKRIGENQTSSDFFVFNADDTPLAEGVQDMPGALTSFSLKNEESHAFYRDGMICLKEEGGEPVIDTGRMKIVGLHNAANTMAALLMVKAFLEKRGEPVDYEKIADACYSFNGLEHRMEHVGEFEGRTFINDSKATTVGAVTMALKGLSGNGILIVGGRTKGDDYSRLAGEAKGRLRAVICIGESREMFADIFSGFVTECADDMDDALARGMALSREGDMILLSPACASFDMYKSYDERGKAFKAAFERLQKGETAWT